MVSTKYWRMFLISNELDESRRRYPLRVAIQAQGNGPGVKNHPISAFHGPWLMLRYEFVSYYEGGSGDRYLLCPWWNVLIFLIFSCDNVDMVSPWILCGDPDIIELQKLRAIWIRVKLEDFWQAAVQIWEVESPLLSEQANGTVPTQWSVARVILEMLCVNAALAALLFFSSSFYVENKVNKHWSHDRLSYILGHFPVLCMQRPRVVPWRAWPMLHAMVPRCDLLWQYSGWQFRRAVVLTNVDCGCLTSHFTVDGNP